MDPLVFARLAHEAPFHDAGHGYDVFGLHPPTLAAAVSAAAPLYDRYFRVDSQGIEHVPATGPAILVANHGGVRSSTWRSIATQDRGRNIHAQNVTATRELMRRCTDHPTIRRFVYRSFAEVYALEQATSDLLDEEAALDFDPAAPQWLRDRVEADLTVCAHLGGSLQIAVLRCAEILAADRGSQLWDYLSSRVCLRPLGFDPMLNVLSLEDAVAAIAAAARSTHTGVFNIPGADTLPLSRAIAESGRLDVPVPGPFLAPLYGLRRWVTGFEFRYDLNLRRFHFGGVMDGTRARRLLGYVPGHPAQWSRAWWRLLAERLANLRSERT